MLFLIFFFNSYEEESINGIVRTPEGGYLYNIEHSDALQQFSIAGFQFHYRLPLSLKKRARPLSKTSQIWILQAKDTRGAISVTNLQRERRASQSVIVSITYYMSWEREGQVDLSVTGIGINPETHELEEQVERLTAAANGESVKPAYCRKLVYLGPADEVYVFSS